MSLTEQGVKNESVERPLSFIVLICTMAAFYVFRAAMQIRDAFFYSKPETAVYGELPSRMAVEGSVEAALVYLGMLVLCYLVWKCYGWAKIALLVLVSLEIAICLFAVLVPMMRQFGIGMAWISLIVSIYFIIGLSLPSTRQLFKK